ncbi:hypothetical protein GCM10011506_18740 [Marivirga lumbricoides]|uniref:DUF3347 domain-containing protein n=1 Tax=Marivirga lumbricoides TaxID=1046115 RepID=A0A2T4DS23_9BACT|nr:hypothetical protein C9994_06440 [Marivirga lumbricoides]GGC33546.1 hypothetical protein GCM10011506_18740 [Marivirga lumbricoides]
MRNIISMLITSIFIISSCQNKAGDNAESEDVYENESYENPKTLGSEEEPVSPKTLAGDDDENLKMLEQNYDLRKDEATKLLSFYLEIKQALVEGELEKASASAASMQQVLDNKDSELAESISRPAKSIMQAVQLEEQRKKFSELSTVMYDMLKMTNILDYEIYWQYCPMALNDEGAYWLSSSEQIENPYFGETMLRCGSTKEVL